MYYLYILESQTKPWRYIGTTDDVDKRIHEHNRGKTRSTKPYRPFIIIYTEIFENKSDARKRELYLKKNYKAREEIFNSL